MEWDDDKTDLQSTSRNSPTHSTNTQLRNNSTSNISYNLRGPNAMDGPNHEPTIFPATFSSTNDYVASSLFGSTSSGMLYDRDRYPYHHEAVSRSNRMNMLEVDPTQLFGNQYRHQFHSQPPYLYHAPSLSTQLEARAPSSQLHPHSMYHKTQPEWSASMMNQPTYMHPFVGMEHAFRWGRYQSALPPTYPATQSWEDQYGTSTLCNKCNDPIIDPSQSRRFNNKQFHDLCFICDTCHMKLSTNFVEHDGKLYCEADFVKVKVSRLTSPSDVSVEELTDEELREMHGAVLTQPAKYQISNYNIHPVPSLTFDPGVPRTARVSALLMESSTQSEVLCGLQAGQIKILKAGGKVLFFSGLKLSKMGKIKRELHQRNIKVDKFYIRFVIGSKYIDTSHFKLVSSCTQLPSELKPLVRPPKKSVMARLRSQKAQEQLEYQQDQQDKLHNDKSPIDSGSDSISRSDSPAKQDIQPDIPVPSGDTNEIAGGNSNGTKTNGKEGLQ